MKASTKWLVLICIWLLTGCGGSNSTSTQMKDSSVVRLANVPADGFSSGIAVATDGTAMAVWSRGPAPFTLWASHYTPALGWGAPERIGTGTGHEAWAQIAINSSGRAVVAWGRMVGLSVNLLAATYNTGTGWSEPTVLEGGSLINPQVWVSIGADGVACVSWQTFAPVGGNSGTNILVQARKVDGAWAPPEIVASGTSTTQLGVSGNSSGKSFAIYHQSHPDPVDPITHRYNTYVRSFDPALGWTTPLAIGNYVSELNDASYLNPTTTPGHSKPTISVDDQGKASALWSEVYYAGGNYQVTANNFDPATGWGTPVKVADLPADSHTSFSPFVFDGSASFISFVDVLYPSNLSNIFVASFKAGNWNCEKVVDSLPFYAMYSAITVGTDGTLLLTWLQQEGEHQTLWMKTFHPGAGWGPASRVDSGPGGIGDYKTTRDASGRILVMWSELGATTGGVYVKTLQ